VQRALNPLANGPSWSWRDRDSATSPSPKNRRNEVPRRTRGEQFRADVLAAYDLDDLAAEHLLDALVHTIDELALLEAAVRSEGVLLDGARGQKIANPALSAITKHRVLLAKLLAELFPAEDRETTSQKAARAARARWTKAGVRR
jgi:hypothetical protein